MRGEGELSGAASGSSLDTWQEDGGGSLFWRLQGGSVLCRGQLRGEKKLLADLESSDSW